MRLSDAIDGYLLLKATRASAQTIATDRVMLGQLTRWAADCDTSAVTPAVVRRYLAYHRERGLSEHTIRRHHAVISALFKWLTSPDIALTNANPVATVPAPKLPALQPRALTQEQVAALLEAAVAGRNPRRAKAFLLVMLDTGCRISEITGACLSDVDMASGRIRVTGKGQRERYVYIGKRALAALWLYVKEERPDPAVVGDDHLFLTQDGYPTNRNSWRCYITRLSKRVGFHVHLHMFRHTSAIEHLRRGMDLASLQHMLGHQDIKTTRAYLTALNDEDVADRARRTSPGDNWRL